MKYLITTLIFVFLISCSSTTNFVGSNKIPEKDLRIIKLIKEGYSYNGLNQIKADSLYRLALNLSEEINYPYSGYRYLKENEKIVRENKTEDWNGSEEQKIYSVLKIYNAVKADYAGFDVLINFDWQEKIIEFLPKFISSKDVEEYTKNMCELISLLNDNHTRVDFSKEFRKVKKNALPPLRVKFIDEKLYIKEILTDSLKNILYPGLEILRVDDRKPLEIIKEYQKYGCLSKVEKENNYRAYNVLKGIKGSVAKIEILDRLQNKRSTIKLERNIIKWKNNNPFETKYLEDKNILLIKINTFMPKDSILTSFKKIFKHKDFDKVKGIIFDIRNNGGGFSLIGYQIISHIIDKPAKYGFKFKISSHQKTGYVPPVGNFIFFFCKMFNDYFEGVNEIKPHENLRFNGKIAVLISESTGSAAEDFAATIKENRIGKIIGEPSCGSTGNGIFYFLPMYNKVRICINMGQYSDGTIWQGIGILPDIEVMETPESYRQGRDVVLEKALDYMKNKN